MNAIPSTDMTDKVIAFLKARFPGFEVVQPLATIEDKTKKIAGVKSGSQIKARGSAQAGNLISHEGSLQLLSVAGLNIWFTDPHLKITFSYTSTTHAERWVWPGGAKVDNVWDSLHPAGTITSVLHMKPQKSAILHLETTVHAGNDDRANSFVKDRIVPQMFDKLDALFEEFTKVTVEPG